MANHGLVVVGCDRNQAFERTGEAKTIARIFLRASAAGTPAILPDHETKRVVGRFRDFGYGPPEH